MAMAHWTDGNPTKERKDPAKQVERLGFELALSVSHAPWCVSTYNKKFQALATEELTFL
jgi:hypothetical protein